MRPEHDEHTHSDHFPHSAHGERIAALESRCEVLQQTVMTLLARAFVGQGGSSGGDGSGNQQFAAILKKLDGLKKQGEQAMAFQQDALDAITANTTLIGSVKTLVQQVLDGLGDQVTPEAKAAILSALGGNREQLAEVEAALRANTAPPTP